jgi:PDZ domain-containing secreted protein
VEDDGSKDPGNRGLRAVGLVLFLVVFLVMPVAFFFADSGASLIPSPVVRVYSALDQIFGELVARLIFCGTWLTFGSLIFWRFYVRKERMPDDQFDWAP